MPASALPKLLIADPDGKVREHPTLLAAVRQGPQLAAPTEAPIALPTAARLVHLPGRRPVGVDPTTGKLVVLDQVRIGRRTVVPNAVGALLPPGYTRTLLPGEIKADGPILPQWAYAAAGWGRAGPVAWALRTDRRTHWDPDRYSTPELKALVEAHQRRFAGNRVLAQLRTCALVYRCFTSQNIFYVRDEGALPVSVACNARCVGCISDQPKGGPPASHDRMSDGPSAEELGQVGAYHLANAPGRTMVSFGQGCEGEPLTRYRVIAEAIRWMRAHSSAGSINVNTNASAPAALDALFDAGLDTVRVSLNSASKELYEAYYNPIGYGWEQVEQSLRIARDRGAYLALNLLVFPGITDRRGEVAALSRLVRRYRVDQVQTRSLAIDPLQYVEVAQDLGEGGAPLGIRGMIASLRRAAPWLRVGNFARGLRER